MLKSFIIGTLALLTATLGLLRTPITPAQTHTYTNPAFGFTLTLPLGFNPYPPDTTDATTTGQAVVFESPTGSVQLVVSPYQYTDTTLTLADIEHEARGGRLCLDRFPRLISGTSAGWGRVLPFLGWHPGRA